MGSLPHQFPSRRDVVVLAFLAGLGILNLACPFGGDQALFTLGALKLHGGAALYRDFWDLKQPGIYYFYLAAGTLFGFSEIAIHLFELLYFLAFAAVLQVSLRSYVRSAWSAALAPLVVIGPYYAIASPTVLTQLEALVGFPLYLVVWLTRCAAESTGGRRFAFALGAGAAAAVVAIFKLVYLLPVAAIVAAALAVPRRGEPGLGLRGIGTILAAGTIGLLAPLTAVAAALAHAVGAKTLYDTFVADPALILAQLPRPPIHRLVYAFAWFLERFAPLAVVAAVGLYEALRSRRAGMAVPLAAWLAAGAAALLSQRFSWWPYQTLLLSVPVALLALFGFEAIGARLSGLSWWSDPRARRSVVAAGLALAFGFFAVKTASKAAAFASHGFFLTAAARQAYQFRTAPEYREAFDETAFLREPGAKDGDIYVCGDPVYYLFAKRNQAVALTGWALELFLPEQWNQLRSELTARRPPYVFVTRDYADLMRNRSPQTLAFLASRYRPLRTDAHGTWYELRDR